ncbi:DUF2767 family protein [Rahnella sp. L72c]|uniref:DUF2767 family protein n=1 Tax=Rahnella perminowiae TaxID=2816244 RepID=A0ABS6L6A3_9GAMM|nr:DUF2767 family protein [Rahnella perminowiae]MBU9837354.1 DUF2767 family protein [Rahnella perminowiae]
MDSSNPVFEEACRLIGECCVMLARNGEEVSRRRIALRLERVQESAITITGKPNDALSLAIEVLKAF